MDTAFLVIMIGVACLGLRAPIAESSPRRESGPRGGFEVIRLE